MSARIGLFAFALTAPLALAVGQQTSPTKLEDSNPPAKVDSQSSRPHVRLGGAFIGSGYARSVAMPKPHFSGITAYTISRARGASSGQS
jgi:hypothetical protein